MTNDVLRNRIGLATQSTQFGGISRVYVLFVVGSFSMLFVFLFLFVFLLLFFKSYLN